MQRQQQMQSGILTRSGSAVSAHRAVVSAAGTAADAAGAADADAAAAFGVVVGCF